MSALHFVQVIVEEWSIANMPIKSVHITNYFHEQSGGVSTSYRKLLTAAARHKRFVRLIVPGASEMIEEVNEFAKIYYVAAKPAPIFDKRYRLMMPWHYAPDHSSIRKILREEMPDMIEIYDNYLLTALAGIIRTGHFKQIKRPMLIYFTGERLDTIIASFVSKSRLANWFARRLLGNFDLPMFDYYIAISNFVAEELFEAVSKSEKNARSDRFFNLCSRFLKAATVPFAERLVICTRGVNVDFFNPRRCAESLAAEIRDKHNLPKNSKLLISSTRISPEKNIRLIPAIMKNLEDDSANDFRFLIAGAGPLYEWLKDEAAKFPPNKIVLLGHLAKEELADYYANCDVFVHPNPREPFGNVVLEAMASGIPILVPNSGGVLTFATNENAWLAEATGESFARAIRQICADPEVRKRKIAKALETARNNSDEIANDRLFATYDAFYQDFLRRKELFTNVSRSSTFDFASLDRG